jgi:hypothetical protein
VNKDGSRQRLAALIALGIVAQLEQSGLHGLRRCLQLIAYIYLP